MVFARGKSNIDFPNIQTRQNFLLEITYNNDDWSKISCKLVFYSERKDKTRYHNDITFLSFVKI